MRAAIWTARSAADHAAPALPTAVTAAVSSAGAWSADGGGALTCDVAEVTDSMTVLPSDGARSVTGAVTVMTESLTVPMTAVTADPRGTTWCSRAGVHPSAAAWSRHRSRRPSAGT